MFCFPGRRRFENHRERYDVNNRITPDDLVLFIGDSVTDTGRDRSDPRALGDGYVSRAAAELAKNGVTRVLNRGISGNRVVDLRARWAEDCIDLRPTVLSILVGINDTWRRYDSDDPTSTDAFETVYRGILTQVRDRLDTRLVLMEPFLIPVREEQESWREDLDPKIDVVHRLADEFGATLVRTDELLGRAASNTPPAELADDGVHPTPHGHSLIASAWLATVDEVVSPV